MLEVPWFQVSSIVTLYVPSDTRVPVASVPSQFIVVAKKDVLVAPVVALTTLQAVDIQLEELPPEFTANVGKWSLVPLPALRNFVFTKAPEFVWIQTAITFLEPV